MQPLGDRVLVRVEDSADVTIGGVVLPDSAKERPLRCGAGLLVPVPVPGWGGVNEVGEGNGCGCRGSLSLHPCAAITAGSARGRQQSEPNSAAALLHTPHPPSRTASPTPNHASPLKNKHTPPPNSGTIVRVGPGKYDKEAEGGRTKSAVTPGDRVLYFKYAGDNMETPSGEKFIVLREDDILCKA